MKKILIVDDMEVSLMMTENMLSGTYKTFCASSGLEAMEIYRKEKPDMVLSDLRMPGLSGYELQLALQEEYHEIIPFMFMTADHDEETESKGFDNGAMDFIRKPFRPDVLLRRVGNILQTVEQIQGLKKTSTIDALTDLLNKASSEAELTKVCKSVIGALMMIDLDSFKLVNDIYGHNMGDKVLVSFADILRSAFRPGDILGRMGGDEFIAFCKGVHDEDTIAHKATFINERITEAAKKLMGEDMNIPLGASIGCVFVPHSGNVFSELYKKADKALYTVKQNGKHGYNILREDTPVEDNSTEIARIDQIEMVLGERNIEEGAFVLPFASFRTIYRFLKRTRGNYAKNTCLLIFSLERHKEGNYNLTDANDEFFTVIRKTLRKGDVITQNGKNQFFVLLTNADAYRDVVQVTKRIEENWDQTPACKYYTFEYEWSVIDQ
ncbi:MAG: diguanylate cyclase [Selenomonadaceae bacterium]|nr:diguanylate cyclase [Selenomonadaceae bacterium]